MKRARIKSARKVVSPSVKKAQQIAHWHRLLAPMFPDIDPHDLDLIIAAQLMTYKERTEIMFLKRRRDGRYVF